MCNSWRHLTCIHFAFKVEFCGLSLCGFFITVSGAGNRTDLRGAFTESVNINFLTSPLRPVSVVQKKDCQPCFAQMSNLLTYPWTALSWWLWMMRQLNSCSSLAWRSSVAKQCIERTGWNDEEDFFNFLLAYTVAHYFHPGKTLIDCISSSSAIATVTSRQGGQTTIRRPHAAHKSM